MNMRERLAKRRRVYADTQWHERPDIGGGSFHLGVPLAVSRVVR